MIRAIYIDCTYGISGDMFVSALLHASDAEGKELFKKALEELRKEGISAQILEVSEKGILGYRLSVDDGSKRYERVNDMLEALKRLNISDEAKDLASEIIEGIAEAEAKVHGKDLTSVHFHEIGIADTLFDAVCASVLITGLDIKQVFSSAVAVGSGEVETMHGKMPVPTPATAELLKGMPLTGRNLSGEVTTPTGASILRALKPQFIFPDGFFTESIGYGIGTFRKPHPNYLRVFLGWLKEEAFEMLYEVCTNIDDATPQNLSFVLDELLRSGALEAWVENIVMKKSRAGFKLCFLATENKLDELVDICFKHTSTIGLRYHPVYRKKLERNIEEVDTEFGRVRVKVSWFKGEPKFSAEFDDCIELARKFGLPISFVKRKAEHDCALRISKKFKSQNESNSSQES